MNTKLFKIAIQNVTSHKRRTTLNVLTFALNVLIILFGFGMMKGQFDSMFEKMIDLKSGHFKIYNKDYIDEKLMMPLDINIKNPEAVVEKIKGIKHIVAVSPRIIHGGITSNTKKKMNIIVYGIDMAMEKKILSSYDNINGNAIKKGSSDVLIGKKLSDMLGMSVLDSMLLYSQTSKNANNLVDVSVSGIYANGYTMMEKSNMFIPYDFAQIFFDMEGAATEIIIKIDNTRNVPAVKKELVAIVNENFPDLVVLDWKEENPELIAMAAMKQSNFMFVVLILVFLAVFIISNTLTMSVFERIPEVGTIRAIGMEKKDINAMFLIEGGVLGTMGFLVGAILSAPLVYYMNTIGMVVPTDAMEGFDMPIDSQIKAVNSVFDYVVTAAVCIGGGLFGAILPARRAAKTNIVKALKRGVR